MHARVFIFGMQVDDYVLHCGIANQPSAYSSLYLSDCLSFQSFNNDFFVKDFFGFMQARVVTFDMQIVDDVLYCGMHGNRFK